MCKGSNSKGLSLTDPCREHWVSLGVCLLKASIAAVAVPVKLCTTVTYIVIAKKSNWVWM